MASYINNKLQNHKEGEYVVFDLYRHRVFQIIKFNFISIFNQRQINFYSSLPKIIKQNNGQQIPFLQFLNVANLSFIQNVFMVKIVDNYTLTNYLGKGQYGKVFKAYHVDTRIDVAVKMIAIDKFEEISKLTELTKNEIQTLRSLEENLNVVKFVEMIKSNHYVYLIYQFCEGGTLEDLLRKRGSLPQKQALSIFRQLINALKTLHQHCILHRDIKPDNIFFKSGHLKLADFGFCKKLRSADDFTQTSLGSPLYMAPQILNGDVYGSKADIWSCGIVLFQMLFGYCPYGHYNIKQMLQAYNSEKGGIKIPSNRFQISPVTEMMLNRMLQKDQFRRISWQDFFYEYDITPAGTLLKKQKDFEYDLMKLMKKNSAFSSITKKNTPPPLKFDWSKITDKSSSVHSEELEPVGMDDNCLDQILQLKRRIKEFQCEHTKMLEITHLVQNLLDCSKEFQYSNAVIYFLVHTLSSLVSQTLAKIQAFSTSKQELLANNQNEAKDLQKLHVVFKNQANSITTKVNSIKITLMQCQTLGKDIFKFPNKAIMRKYLKEYLQYYEENSNNATKLNNQGNKDDTLFLLRIVWGVSQLFAEEQQDKKGRQLRETLSLKGEPSKFDLSVQLNRYLVFLGV